MGVGGVGEGGWRGACRKQERCYFHGWVGHLIFSFFFFFSQSSHGLTDAL